MFDYKDLNLILPYLVLMPIIDLVNHDFRGKAYFFEDESGSDRFLAIKRSVPVPGNENESFARYGVYDAFDTWRSYGFIDESASFVSSVAATLYLLGLATISLGSSLKPRALKDLPPSVGDLQLYIPQVFARRGSHTEIASLAIPGPQAPRALRRALHFLIMEMSAGRANRRDLVLRAEEQIIAANRAYYRDLLAFPHGLSPTNPQHEPIRDNFIRVCDLQLARIEGYVAVAQG